MSPIKEPIFFARDFDVGAFAPEIRRPMLLRFRAAEDYWRRKRSKAPIGLIRDWDQYLDLFRDAGRRRALGEACTWNLASAVAAEEIRRRLPDARIVMVLRNPIDRAYSAYLLFRGHGRVGGSFRSNIERELREGLDFGRSLGFVHFGRYHQAVSRYLQHHARERVRIYLYDDFRHDPRTLLRDLFGFLGIDPDFPVDVSGEYNPPLMPRFPGVNRWLAGLEAWLPGLRLVPPHTRRIGGLYWSRRRAPPMRQEDRALLRSVFADDVRDLGSLIGRDLSHWLSRP